MELELQYFDGCPNWKTAERRLHAALAANGQADVEIAHRKVTSAEQADRVGFRGSPTIIVRGRDPFADESAPLGMACRVYETETGPEGAPSVPQLARALREGLAAAPTWTNWREAVRVVTYSPNLHRTALIALVVGTVLFFINQLDVVLSGDANAVVWLKSAVTYLIPFGVSNAGILVATRRDR